MRKLLVLLAFLLIGPAAADGINVSGPSYLFGTWTPTIIGGTVAGTGQTYTTQVGSYEIIGRQVTIRFNLIVTGIGTATGTARIGGLPVPSVNTASEQGYCYVSNYSVTGLTALNYGVYGVIAINSSIIDLYSGGNTSSTTVTLTQTGGTPYFQGFCSYRAS